MHRTVPAALVAALVLALAACSGTGSGGEEAATGTATTPGAATTVAADEQWPPAPAGTLYEKYGVGVAETGPVLTGDVVVHDDVDPVPTRARILSVTATGSSTLLVWAVTYPDADADKDYVYNPFTGWISDDTTGSGGAFGTMTNGVTLRVAGSDEAMEPSGFYDGDADSFWSDGSYNVCLCTDLDDGTSANPLMIHGLYPALPGDATQVEVTVPQLGTVTVDVTRA